MINFNKESSFPEETNKEGIIKMFSYLESRYFSTSNFVFLSHAGEVQFALLRERDKNPGNTVLRIEDMLNSMNYIVTQAGEAYAIFVDQVNGEVEASKGELSADELKQLVNSFARMEVKVGERKDEKDPEGDTDEDEDDPEDGEGWKKQ